MTPLLTWNEVDHLVGPDYWEAYLGDVVFTVKPQEGRWRTAVEYEFFGDRHDTLESAQQHCERVAEAMSNV